MTQPSPQRRRRRRGVMLTPQGLDKLQTAKTDAEFEENAGNRYTLETLSERTGLAVDTLMKVFACESGVDKQTLKICFRSFNLTLEPTDFYYPGAATADSATGGSEEAIGDIADTLDEPELPEGQVPLDSTLYVERPPVEAESYKAVLQPGALIRIKGSRRMGKTSLMTRILHQATQHGAQTVSLSFQLADRNVFQNLNRLLRWFCASVGLGLKLPNRLGDYWDDLFGSQMSCRMYFEQYLLAEVPQPLVLGLDDVDRLFQYPDLASDFFGLLRTWHEEGKNRDIWRKLRLVVAHSSDVYIPLEINKSPFNVGLPIELKPFTTEQIQDLAGRYDLDWGDQQAAQLRDFVGGQPYLVKKGLYHIWHQDVTLEQILQTPAASGGIYREHLQRQLLNLQRQPELAEAFNQVLNKPALLELDLVQAFQLQSLGLTILQGEQIVPSCELYSQYFQSR